MTRSKKSARRGGRGGKQGADRGEGWRTDVVEKTDMNNERFEKYYKSQNILPDNEWESFMDAMRNPLPTTFRVAGSRQAARLLNNIIKDVHVPHLAGVVFEGQTISPPEQIPWYPEGLAWQFNVSKKVLRKSPEFKKFHSFLVFETEVGNISRQEAVSMLPPLFLEVEPHHRVIDMCAAPGSKRFTLKTPDHKRTHLLIHQSARLPSPALMVTNLDASIFPAIKIPSEQTVFPSDTKPRVAAKKQYQLLFDRILCDVPCSGDGTMRKNPGIWKHWQPMDGNGLHSLQLRILQRAMRMLKKDGRIVYSTCSLNPVENEAVVTAALKSIPGFELIDMSTHLPGLIHRPGVTSWKPTVDRSINTEFPTYDDYIESLPESKRAESKMSESHWPPTPSEAESLNLSRCLRIYPHLQDTGGFFIAILQKQSQKGSTSVATSKKPSETKRQADMVDHLETSEVKKPKLATGPDAPLNVDDMQTQQMEDAEELLDEPTEEAVTAVDIELPSAAASAPEIRFKPKGKGKASDGGGTHFKENPYTYIAQDDPIVKACVDSFDLNTDFPASHMLVRNPVGSHPLAIYDQ
ncbi:Multisite-specific tRNA:(cytosine-C(5))-methyltransferase trm4b [Grifola frondosa]|uniref:Multisite-specific tRNA:(Cytosine-C(5))-methyltransferase trm4b n=1 Tax=Grifola frondosa TaxID=5627 RepID=A0A1C7LPI3_GRIFR|nr:Multisite-specific tRNA:(cytosine-C(5))-methyltransferase trm4b [Grifola frondosa]